MSVINIIKERYNCAGGYGEFLKIAIPLAISAGLGAVEIFTDRTFLSGYSQEAFAASAPAGTFAWAITALFMGTLSYVNVFVAQYYGKKEYRSIGPAIWQSIHLTLVAAFIIFGISFLLEPFFMNIGHPEAVAIEEIKYCKILAYGAFVWIGEAVFSAFFSGQGKTTIVLALCTFGAIINACFDYLLIFGKCGFPEMGINGAALASIISYAILCVIYIVLITSKKNHIIYNTRYIKLNFKFMKRLLRYGTPNGVELFFDGCGFSIFIIIIGNLGITSLAASNIMASIYNIAYMPLLGTGMATSVIVGKYLGENKASSAQLSVITSLHISYTYMILLVIALNVFPDFFISPFISGAQVDFIETVKPLTKSLLVILSMFFLFDTGSIIFSSVLRGAGDTAYVMKIFIFFSIFLEVIPAYLNVVIFKNSIITVWACFIVYVVALCFAFLYKYKTHKWKKMRVIEMDIING
jgi:MATE family multidrug resistance protein